MFLASLVSGVNVVVWYDLHDDAPPGSLSFESYFGLGEHDYRASAPDGLVYKPKPAFFAARTLASFLSGRRVLKRVPLKGEISEDFLVAFESDGHGGSTAYAVWLVSEGTKHIMAAGVPGLSRGCYDAISVVGETLEPMCIRAEGVFNATVRARDAPWFITPRGS